MPNGTFTCVNIRPDLTNYFERMGTPMPSFISRPHGGLCGHVYTQAESDATDDYVAKQRTAQEAEQTRLAGAVALAREQARDPANRARIIEAVRELARKRAQELTARGHDLITLGGHEMWIVLVRERKVCTNMGRGAWGGHSWRETTERRAYALSPQGRLLKLQGPDVVHSRSGESYEIRNTNWSNGLLGPSKTEMHLVGEVSDDEIAPRDRGQWSEKIIDEWQRYLRFADDERLHVGWRGGITSTPKPPPPPPAPAQPQPQPKKRRWFGR